MGDCTGYYLFVSCYFYMSSHFVRSSLRSKRFRGVWKQRKTEERYFRCSVCAENGARTKKTERGGWERGRKETLADKPLDFENLRSPANGARDWLG